ncbi:MAG: aminotransferase class I/II-fold pyridoxal phosphate-dependent enzyme [Planctomycetota bacterium]|jgi:histidinol-phosphate aminotransferase
MNASTTELPEPARRIGGFDAYRKVPPAIPPRLKLDSNEGASPNQEIIQAVLGQVSSWNRYPSASQLEAALAKRHGVRPEQVLVTAGADEALDRICRAYLEPGRKAVCHWPSFEMLPRYTALAGGSFCRIPWSEGKFPIEEFKRGVDADTALLFLVSPNNPTGLAIEQETLKELGESYPSSLLVLDQAYAEFDAENPSATVLELQNGLLLRSFSKAWGLAGLRVGYAIADTAIIDNLRKAGSPYSVAAPSIAIALACLKDADQWLDRSVPQVQRERDELCKDLRSFGFEVAEAKANFVLARGPRADWLRQGLAALGISVRGFPEEPSLRDSLRITCPASATDFAILRQSIATCMAPEGILFDMDGVLVDVSGSYRRAIKATAASWNLDLSSDQIAAAKSEADSNNDWLLTHRLLTRAGKTTSLEEVIARFESFYQGDGERSGFRENEYLAVSVDFLKRLAGKFPLAVVTGRPRQDAERFLEEQGIRSCFKAVLCMEDGPAKPDPSIVNLAMQQAGLQSAWLLGDFPDDLHAARAAGVLPIGVLPPGSDPQLITNKLVAAGAASVLSTTDELESLLP